MEMQKIYSGMTLNEIQRAADQLWGCGAGSIGGCANPKDVESLFLLMANLAARMQEIERQYTPR